MNIVRPRRPSGIGGGSREHARRSFADGRNRSWSSLPPAFYPPLGGGSNFQRAKREEKSGRGPAAVLPMQISRSRETGCRSRQYRGRSPPRKMLRIFRPSLKGRVGSNPHTNMRHEPCPELCTTTFPPATDSPVSCRDSRYSLSGESVSSRFICARSITRIMPSSPP